MASRTGNQKIGTRNTWFQFSSPTIRNNSANSLWVIPGSHKNGKADIKGMIERNGGSIQLPDAVPLICAPGDATIVNRRWFMVLLPTPHQISGYQLLLVFTAANQF